MKVIRHIHPIGQGAFYTERFVDDNNATLANVVYDCGCGINISKQARKLIASSFTKNEIIDILFISHFDSDHINGVKMLNNELEIKCIVIPLLSEEETEILSLLNRENKEYADLLNFLLQSPNLIKIKEIDKSVISYFNNDERRNIDVKIDDKYSITDMYGDDNIIDSFIPLKVSAIPEWCYMPFNFAGQERTKKLASLLKINNIEYSEIISSLKNCSSKQIKEIYNKIEGKTNSNSLCVFSCPQKSTIEYNAIYTSVSCLFPCTSSLLGCLYLGDSNLNDIDERDETIIDYIKSTSCLNEYVDNLGLIQIPHHGSLKSFSSSIFSINPQCSNYFLSYGNNTYGHPADRVVEEILSRKNILHCVNQHKESKLVQCINF